MMDWVFLLLDIVAGSVRVLIGLLLISCLASIDNTKQYKFLRKSIWSVKRILIVLVGNILSTSAIYIVNLPVFCLIILEAVWIVFGVNDSWSFVQYREKSDRSDNRMNLFFAIFYEIVIAFLQFLFAAGLGVLSQNAMFLDSKTKCGQLAVCFFSVLLIAGVFLFLKFWDGTSKDAFRLISSVIVVGFLAVVTLSEQTALEIADDTLEMWIILAIVLMMSLLVFRLRRQYEMEKELARLKAEQAELLERDYVALNNAYALNAKLFHDFHNHIGVLQQLISHEKVKEAEQYLNALQAPVQEMTDTIWTGDETIDYLINSKAAKAKADNIQLQVQVEFPRHTNIKSADLCAILGNLLDNALEAARQVPENEQRIIQLTIRRIYQMLIIKVENRFKVPPVRTGGTLQTTKEQNGLHGWGLKSAQAAAEKYDGMVQTSCIDNTFRAVVTLSYKGVKMDL